MSVTIESYPRLGYSKLTSQLKSAAGVLELLAQEFRARQGSLDNFMA